MKATFSCEPSSPAPGPSAPPSARHSARPPQEALPLTIREFCFWVQNLTNEEQVVVIQARTVLTLAEKVTVTVDAVGTGPGFPKPAFLAQRREDAHPGRRATGRWGWGPRILFASGGLVHAQVSQHHHACL